MANSTLEADALALGKQWRDTSTSIYCEIASLAFVLLIALWTRGSVLSCQKWIHFEGAAGIIAKAAAEMIMIFRTACRPNKAIPRSVLMQLGLGRITIYERPGMFCTLLSNALIWLLAPPGLLEAGIGFAIAVPTVMASRILLNLRGLSGTPDSSELSAATREGIHHQAIQYQHGAPIGRPRIQPTLTQWTVSEDETIIARMQEEQVEKHAPRQGTLQQGDDSPRSSIGKGKGREVDIEMSPVSSSGSKSPIAPVLPHDTYFGRYDF
ncbi:hypothetical protein AG1IA_05812 [Rhizoctonia solani AG-1 IA]|uniref:Transmembrane protein n=1 Tax=Thanatephorus cucumeris (strain AG1-IA) TaxID=983506 RepID=L8WTQ4_THACA|nr:hypothetical protein AG1IA_05812 [Rhizoctonia solani AG-1 IA]